MADPDPSLPLKVFSNCVHYYRALLTLCLLRRFVVALSIPQAITLFSLLGVQRALINRAKSNHSRSRYGKDKNYWFILEIKLIT